jgi:integrase
VRLYHHGQERRFGSFPSKTAAREFYEKAKREQKEGMFFPERYRNAGTETIETLIDRYLIGHSGNTKSQRDERRFGAWWKARLKGYRLQSITPAILEDARQFLFTEQPPLRLLKRTQALRNLKIPRSLRNATTRQPATVNRYFAWLRKVMNVAVRDRKIQANPVSRLKFAKEPRGKTRFLSPEEEATLTHALGPVYAPWARLAILSGMRQAEQFSLKWAQVDLSRGLITLPKTKAGEVQYVRLNEEAKDILEGLTIGNRSVWVFPSENPLTHLDPRNFYDRVWIPAVKQAGIEWVTWHDLRHTFASRLAMAGHNEGTIADLLRHSGTALVKRYAHLSPSHLTAAVESVAAFGKGTRQETISNGTVTETGIREQQEEGSTTEVFD